MSPLFGFSRSNDERVKKLFAEAMEEWAKYESAQGYDERERLITEARQALQKMMKVLLAGPVSTETHHLLVSRLAFSEDDLAPHTRKLIADLGNEAPPLIEVMLLRPEL